MDNKNPLDREGLYRELAQVFIVSWWDFERAWEELEKVLKKYGFERK
jgi:2-oxo-4-hydroxy-4-carboxy--5-ureidoimidazoline (OHCU) decarboxylase